MSWERVWELVCHIYTHSRGVTGKGRLARSQTELCFTRAAKSDAPRPGPSLNRAGLYEFILRLGYAWTSAVYSPKEKLGGRLREFISVFIRPFYDDSALVEHRRTIRDSKHLNKLLYDNLRALEVLYERVKHFEKGEGRSVTLAQASKFFITVKHPDLELTTGKIEQCFNFSMMTVLDEEKRMKKYDTLAFAEFLEMLCRLALVGVTMQDTVEYKVHLLLEAAATSKQHLS